MVSYRFCCDCTFCIQLSTLVSVYLCRRTVSRCHLCRLCDHKLTVFYLHRNVPISGARTYCCAVLIKCVAQADVMCPPVGVANCSGQGERQYWLTFITRSPWHCVIAYVMSRRQVCCCDAAHCSAVALLGVAVRVVVAERC